MLVELSLINLLKTYGEVFLTAWAQFVLIAFFFYGLLWSVSFGLFSSRKIQKRRPRGFEMRREAWYSFSSHFVFAAVVTFCIAARDQNWSYEYQSVSDYGWPYLLLSVWLMFTVHDIWHYALHRLCHKVPWLFRRVHRIHHTFQTPTPWSADAFHPLDALVNISFMPLMVFLFPIHTGVMKGYMFLVVVLNTLGHSGFELLPRGLTKHWLLQFLNTTTAHDLHHQKVHFNFGLYTNILDRLLGTFYPGTFDLYERITGQEAQGIRALSQDTEART